jgi:hypothetical protein
MKETILIVFLNIALAQWELVSEDLMSFFVSDSNWNFKNVCDWNTGITGTEANVGNCALNDYGYILVGTKAIKG